MNCQRTSGPELGVLVDRPVDARQQACGFEIGEMLLQIEPRRGMRAHGRVILPLIVFLSSMCCSCLELCWVDASTNRNQAGPKMREYRMTEQTRQKTCHKRLPKILRGNVTDRANDPAFIYFPTNYRWSMGLLLCLSAAPSGGAEIDEINRIGRALKDKVGDDNAWFEEWARMGDIVEALRPRRREEEATRSPPPGA